MGNLPPHRVQPARPFLNSGVDYCGPFWVHFKTRGKRPQKAYLAIFCCFATKAVHLELVTDLTTEAFIGALKRFIGRRGHCKTLYCDNATNFVGAKNKLQELKDSIYTNEAKNSIISACSEKEIDFRFIPPRSPHFGGLWEAAVKSAKHLLLKNVSPTSLTYEELETVVIEIEAILNSRPLTPNPSDPNDLNAITPGHALIGSELTSSIDIHAEPPHQGRCERWQLVSDIKHHFWKRWSTEYLNELQQRHKWKGPIKDVDVNTLVIMKEDNVPVLQWPLGRIIKVDKDKDGIVRRCDVKTQRGIFTRALQKLAPLFPEIEDDSNLSQSEDNQQQHKESPTTPPGEKRPLSRLRKAAPIDEMPKTKTSRIQANLLIALVSLMLLPLALCSPINVTKFDNHPGIYFEQIGSVKLSTTNWNMIVYFDLEPYQNELDLLSNGTKFLQGLCDQTTNDTTCSLLVRYFEDESESLESKLNLVSVRRVKRGAVDVIGNLANSLFGVLGSNYEEKMSETIRQLKSDDNHLDKLIKNQTSLIDSTINIMKQTQLNTKAKFDEIDKRISKLLYGHALDSPLSEIHLTSAILTLTVQLLITVSTLQRVQTSIMDVLIDSHHGKLNPLLLTPRQLKREIINIKSHLPQHLQLPIDADNLLQTYKLLKVDGIVADNHVIFTIQLPLSDAREFQLFYLVPVLAINKGLLSAVKTSIKLMAMSPHRDDFFSLSEAQFESCLELKPEVHLCHNIQASYHKSTQMSSCEMDLFTNEPEPRCELQTLEESTAWYQLRHQNQWIYATTKTIKLNAVCEDDTFQLTLNESGIVQLQPKCVIKNDLITIQGHQELQTTIHTAYVSTGIPISSRASLQNLNQTYKNHPFHTTIKELDSIQRQLNSIKESTFPSQQITYHHHGLIIAYILSILVISLLLRFIWVRCRRSQRKTITSSTLQQVPTAAPRLQSSSVTEC